MCVHVRNLHLPGSVVVLFISPKTHVRVCVCVSRPESALFCVRALNQYVVVIIMSHYTLWRGKS